MVNYFFDTYALVEMIQKNPNYDGFNDFPLVTTVLNKIELYWWALTRYGQELAEILLESLTPTQEINDDLIREAMLFRRKYNKRDFSYADSLGYAFARKHDLLFLTGDNMFKDLPGVEFVK